MQKAIKSTLRTAVKSTVSLLAKKQKPKKTPLENPSLLSKEERRPQPIDVKHGQHIFVYNNLRTNQVVYSLTRALNNNEALKQLPFLGKKTVPASLRKDLWHPMAVIEFPTTPGGLLAYRKLREFRRLHETTYSLSLITCTSGPHKGMLLSKKARGKVLMNQKANSVADMAAVLLLQQRESARWENLKVEFEQSKEKQRAERQKAARRQRLGIKEIPLEERVALAGAEGVRILWTNLLDAEYAQTWPEEVTHGVLGQSRYTAAYPPEQPKPWHELSWQERERGVPLSDMSVAGYDGAPAEEAPKATA